MGAAGSKFNDVKAAAQALGKDECARVQKFYEGVEDKHTKKIDANKFKVCGMVMVVTRELILG